MTTATPTASYSIDTDILFPKQIRFHADLTFGEKIFLAELVAMKQGCKECPYNTKHLAILFGVTHQTISNWVKNLMKLELLTIEVDASKDGKKFLVAKIPGS
jgi:hypothetical protein